MTFTGTVQILEVPVNDSSTLYWSHFKMYEDCPQLFLWTKGWDGIDCGGGDGRPKPNPSEDSKEHAVMGIAIQYAIEKMYNGELYKDPKNLLEVMQKIAREEFQRLEAKPRNNINWQNSRITRQEALKVVEDGVHGYLKTMKAHRFLGPYARAEVNIFGWINKWTSIGGRADTIVRRDDTGITILDGKNTKWKMKYTDPDQLRWYALLFKLSYKKTPDRLAFVWYRFPHGMITHNEDGSENVETGVEWIEFDEEDLQGLAKRVLDVKKKMHKKKFDPTPTPSRCRLCDYESVCDARQAQRAANAAKRKKKDPEPIEMEVTGKEGGVTLFTL